MDAEDALVLSALLVPSLAYAAYSALKRVLALVMMAASSLTSASS